MPSPRETKNLDGYGSPPLEWARVIEALDAIGHASATAEPYGARRWKL
jgi:hypothetical protein